MVTSIELKLLLFLISFTDEQTGETNPERSLFTFNDKCSRT